MARPRLALLCVAIFLAPTVAILGTPSVAIADAAPGGLSPSDIASAYHLPHDANGLPNGGNGQTVALIEAGDAPNAEADMGQYRQQWGLPACTTANGCFTKINQRNDNVMSGTISSGLNQNQCVDVYGGDGTNDKQLDLYQCIPGVWQWWRLAADGTLRSNANPWQRLNTNGDVGMCMDARTGGTTAGTAAVINDCSGASSQKWAVQNGNVVNTNSGLCLATQAGASVNQTPLVLQACNANDASQRWTTNFNSKYPQPSGGNVSNGSDLEWTLDTDAVSAACPNCHILMVEADDFSLDSLGTAINEAVQLGAKYVSNSWGYYEDGLTLTTVQTFDTRYLNHPGVLLAFDTGDEGYNNKAQPPHNGPTYPASSNKTLAVGGTTLTRNANTLRGWTESVWAGSGSGCSAFDAAPYWQHVPACNGMKATADVSAVADPADFWVYNSVNNPNSPWLSLGGTSLATPLVTAMYAMAGVPASYSSPPSFPYLHDLLLNEVLDNNNGTCGSPLCAAGQGWDGPTGLGTPRSLTAFIDHGAAGTLVSGDSKSCVSGASTTNGSQLAVATPCNASAAGQWWAEYPGFSQFGDYSITGISSALQTQGKCMDTQSANVTDHTAVVLNTCTNGATSQQWKRGPISGRCRAPTRQPVTCTVASPSPPTAPNWN